MRIVSRVAAALTAAMTTIPPRAPSTITTGPIHNMRGHPMTVRAVVVREAVARAALARGGSILSDVERRAYRRLASARRADWLAGRIAAKEAYRRYAKPRRVAPGRIVIRHVRTGAPRLVGRDGIHVSIAHSAGWGAAAVASFPVGIDLERVRRHGRRVLSHIVGGDELPYLGTVGGGKDALVCLAWVVKESVLKALEVGLGTSPRALRIVRRDGDRFRVVASADRRGPRVWTVTARIVDGYAVALAVPVGGGVRLVRAWYLPARV
jgi:4'-phosphopantetheinyl transferase